MNLASLANAEVERAQLRLSEASKLVDYVVHTHPIEIGEAGIETTELDYVDTLITCRRLDEAYEFISRNFEVTKKCLARYFREMRMEGRATELPGQLEALEERFEPWFQRSSFEYKKLFARYRAKAELQQAIDDQPIERTVKLYLALDEPDELYWLRYVNQTRGVDALETFVDLARRGMMQNKYYFRVTPFAEAGWSKELLETAAKVEAIKRREGDQRYYRGLQQRLAVALGREIEFETADAAIKFAEDYISVRSSRSAFLLECARAWVKKASLAGSG